MRYGNGTAVLMDDYLYCGKRKNQPRIHHLICENRCRYRKKCVFYNQWLEEVAGKKPKPMRKKKTTKKRRRK